MFSVFSRDYSDQHSKNQFEEFNVLMDKVNFVGMNYILERLKVQKGKLEVDCASSSATMLDRQKNVIISAIYNSICQTIDFMQNKFQEVSEKNEVEVTKARYELVMLCFFKFIHILSDDLSKEKIVRSAEILNTHRGTVRNFALYPLHYALVGAAIVAGGPASLLGVFGLGIVSHIGLCMGENILGINAETKSLQLTADLMRELIKLETTIGTKLDKLSPDDRKKINTDIWTDVYDRYSVNKLNNFLSKT